MIHLSRKPRAHWLTLLCSVSIVLCVPIASAEAISEATIQKLEKELLEAKEASSDARKRLAVKRTIRDAEELIEANKDKPERFLALEFLFRAQQQLISMDDDSKHRKALIEICAELVKAPDEYAHLKFQADLLLSQTELAKKGASAEERAKALRPLIERYVETQEGAKVLRVAMVMALELGDVGLVADIREMMAQRYAADHEMIKFQREKLGGQVLGAPMAGTFKRSDGKIARLPMDILGRATVAVFWSKEGEGLDFVKGLAASSKAVKDEQQGRMGFISINLDDLPDAGESIIRGFGVDWPVLHLPGGREHPIYQAYTQTDPKIMNVTPTGQTALIMSGVGRERTKDDGTPDFERYFGSALARGWSEKDYAMQVATLMAGDFLVFDPEGFDATSPPEMKAAVMGKQVAGMKRTGDFVPEDTLLNIQNALVAPPERYRLSYPEADAAYEKLEKLCRDAISAHPNAPDLWIVRNRLMIALMGQWKITGDLQHFEAAVAEAQTAMKADYPKGCDVIARFCLARAALREVGEKSGELIDAYVADQGGESASGPVLATALLLALDVADRMRVESLREEILNNHTEYSMMWVFSSALLNRHHTYWMFQVPFTAGWSYGRREGYFMSRGRIEQGERMLKAELQTADGKTLRIPEDLEKEWTLIGFSQSAPWEAKRDDGLPYSPHRMLQGFTNFANARPDQDVDVMLAIFDGDPKASQEALASNRNKVECEVVTIPNGLDNPLIHRLGIVGEDSRPNMVLVRKDGRIGGFLSGLGRTSGEALIGTIRNQDEAAVMKLLDAGKVDEAKQLILKLAPPYDPEAVDERGRKLKEPKYSIDHLRARALVYAALGEFDKALADAEEVYSITFSQSGGMSMRTEELDEAEVLRAEIQKRMEGAK